MSKTSQEYAYELERKDLLIKELWDKINGYEKAKVEQERIYQDAYAEKELENRVLAVRLESLLLENDAKIQEIIQKTEKEKNSAIAAYKKGLEAKEMKVLADTQRQQKEMQDAKAEKEKLLAEMDAEKKKLSAEVEAQRKKVISGEVEKQRLLSEMEAQQKKMSDAEMKQKKILEDIEAKQKHLKEAEQGQENYKKRTTGEMERLTEKVKQLEAGKRDLEVRMREMKKEFQARELKTITELEAKKQKALAELEDKRKKGLAEAEENKQKALVDVELKQKKNFSAAFTKQQEYLAEAEQRFEELKKQNALEVANFRKIISKLESTKNNLEAEKKELEANGKELLAKAEKKDEMLSAAGKKIEDLKNQNIKEIEKLQEELRRLEVGKGAAEAAQKELQLQLDNAKKEFGLQLSNMKKELDVQVSNAKKEFQLKEEKASSGIELKMQKLLSEAEAKQQKMQAEAEQKQEELKSGYKQVVGRLTEEISKLEKEKKALEEQHKSTKAESKTKELKILSESGMKVDELKMKYEQEKERLEKNLQQLEMQRKELENQLDNARATSSINEQKFLSEAALREQKLLAEAEQKYENLKSRYLHKVESLSAEINRERDLRKNKLKNEVGESAEKYIETEFEKIRSYAFPTARFEKEGDFKIGEKGEYIYRETDKNGKSIFSILFEVKNDFEDGKGKQKNEDFLKRLDKSRKTKNCDYAVLVSMLEGDNDFYNVGIADVSYKYPKTYVIRPPFFVPLIGLLRNAFMDSLECKRELETARKQNREAAQTHATIEEIEKMIRNLKKGKSE